ncbi:MAG: hypothetical protein HOA72_23150, partial [Desulfobacula sp.]|uniref:Rid family hydrolase n=1 Tax=Desulfobacula sp. TaxID=2593537 RepID=UPI002A087BFA|nr:hypothetical protein [Desulfobacula sp.]
MKKIIFTKDAPAPIGPYNQAVLSGNTLYTSGQIAIDPKTGENAALLSKEVHDIIMDNKNLLDSSIIYDRDFRYDYFGFKTLTRSYLMKLNGNI